MKRYKDLEIKGGTRLDLQKLLEEILSKCSGPTFVYSDSQVSSPMASYYYIAVNRDGVFVAT